MNRNQLILKHIPFVKYNARKRGKERWYDDLISVGHESLVTVVDLVYPSYPDVYTDSYIIKSIDNAMINYLRKKCVNEPTMFMDNVTSKSNWVTLELMDYMRKHLYTDKDWFVFNRMLEGYNNNDIAGLLKVYPYEVSIIRQRIRDRVLEYLR